jgi:hypothetical protein
MSDLETIRVERQKCIDSETATLNTLYSILRSMGLFYSRRNGWSGRIYVSESRARAFSSLIFLDHGLEVFPEGWNGVTEPYVYIHVKNLDDLHKVELAKQLGTALRSAGVKVTFDLLDQKPT